MGHVNNYLVCISHSVYYYVNVLINSWYRHAGVVTVLWDDWGGCGSLGLLCIYSELNS